MSAIKILGINAVKTVGDGKKMLPLEVLTLDTRETLNVSCFIGKQEDRVTDGDYSHIKIGTDYEIELKVTEHKGKKQYSTGLWLMKELPKPEPEQDESTEPTQEMWAEKERRDFKGRCLMYAIETIKLTFPAQTFETENESIGMATMIASQYMDYIYQD